MPWRRALSCDDLARAARGRLPASIYGYVHGAAEDQATLAANREAFAQWQFLPRLPADVSRRHLATELWGQAWAAPLGVAPMGVAGLCHFDGDVALARAAAARRLPFILSAASTVPLERVLREAPGTWMQAYLPAMPEVIDPWLARVEAAGVPVLVVTIDVPVASQRENELRNGFSIPLKLGPRLVAGGLARPRWLAATFCRTLLKQGVPCFENFSAERGGPIVRATRGDHRAGRAAMSWDMLARMRERWRGRFVVKGVLHPEAAAQARRIGADGLIVSNHGGRQLDGAIAALDALPAIAAAAGPELVLMMDGGIRRGTDVLKARALGARMVFVGRPAMYGLALGGEAGAAKALELLQRECDVDLALLGCPDHLQLGPAWLHRRGEPLRASTP